MDHNKLQGALGSIYSSRVHGLIDHHGEENAVPQDTNPEPRVVEKCGSCTSLVIRTFKSTWDALSTSALSSGAAHTQGDHLVDDGMVRKVWDAQIAKLALASVLIDTADLTAESKVETADQEAVQYLNAKIQSSSRDAGTWDRTQFYREINDAKTNIDGLEFDEILRKDYKEWTQDGTKLGISSVVKPMEFLTGKTQQSSSTQEDVAINAFDKAIEEFMRSKSLSIFAIMTAFTSPEQTFRRELFLQATDTSAAAVSKFSKSACQELGLEKLHLPGVGAGQSEDGSSANDQELRMTRKLWTQKNVAESRKQVAPLLREAI